MVGRRGLGVLGTAAIVMSACTATVTSDARRGAGSTDVAITAALATTTTAPPTSSSTTPVSTTPATTTATTTTIAPAPDIHDPACVVEVQPFDSLRLIGDRFDDETVNVVSLRAENGLPDADLIDGQLLDVCVGNGLDDVTGAERTDPDADVVEAAVRQNVEIQQLVLNRLFEGLGPPDLLVDGISGPVTRQRLCAARLALGLPVSRQDMAPGSAEEQALLAASELPVPASSATASGRWILIDRTCQIMFAGEGPDTLRFVFPTSTGSAGFETRDQDRSPAFRFDPAVGNGGWHNSTDFPVAADNPLNGNMYRPLYFDLGQAIHGANNVRPRRRARAALDCGSSTRMHW